MRIRKRFPPPSDPQLSNTNIAAVVQQEKAKNEYLPSDLPNKPLPQPSDQLGSKARRWVFFGGNSNQENMKEKDVKGEDEKGGETEKCFSSNHNHNKKERLPQLSSSSDPVDHGRWYEEDKVMIPLKKRRDESYNTASMMNKETTTIELANMKSKTNKKFPHAEEGFDNQKIGVNNEKKSKRGSVIVEGSRCSRANGRGWRCCQQTLVGYSLCEHHLGKGRSLRTISTSVRNSSNNDNMGEKRPLLMAAEKKKMKKVGMVKARSLSSLLGQTTDNAVAALIDVDNNYIKKDIADVSAPNLNS